MLNYMQSFVKIGGHVFEIFGNTTQRDIHLLLLGYQLSKFSVITLKGNVPPLYPLSHIYHSSKCMHCWRMWVISNNFSVKFNYFSSTGKTLSNDKCIAFNWMGQDFAEGVCRFDHLHQQAWCLISENTWSYCNSNCTVYNGRMLVKYRFMIIW